MGCCSSSADPPADMAKDRPNVAGGVPDEFKKDLPPLLPFAPKVRGDVEKALSSGDEIYLFCESAGEEGYLCCDGGSEAVVAGALCDESVLVIETLSGSPASGEDIFLKFKASGNYLNFDDEPGAHRSPEAGEGDKLQVFKVGRPMRLRHGDSVYVLARNLSNFVEVSGPSCVARRWEQGPAQTFKVHRKAFLDSAPDENTRALQFAAFDMDANGTISKAEMSYILNKAGNSEDINAIMGAADPDGTNEVTREKFDQWVTSGSIEEERLQHGQVLGNIAQRCSDCLDEEWALIEVLAMAVPGQGMKDVVAKYQDMFGEDLLEKITKKASEQDGWIMSNYWQTVMRGLVQPEPAFWVRALNDAMRGWGTDEGTLLALVCTMPERLRDGIFALYSTTYGQTLEAHIESEISGNFKKVLLFQCMSPTACRAKVLDDAMNGLGTDEGQLIRVICSLDIVERKELCNFYEEKYGKNLLERVKSETSGDYQKALVGMLSAEISDFDVEADCQALKEAMDGWGTDESALIRFICSKSAKQMEVLVAKYPEIYDGKNLLDRVTSETSGYFQEVLQGCIRHPMKQLAVAVKDCVAGFGTCDVGLITLLVHLPDYKRESLRREYWNENKRDILDAIAEDTSGDYKDALLALVKTPPRVWAEALTGAMKGFGTADELLINFMVVCKDSMAEVRTAFEDVNKKPLYDWIKSETSGDYKKSLLALVARDSENEQELLPIYWAQRLHDSLYDNETLIEVLTSAPAVVIRRATKVYEEVYGASLKQKLQTKCDEKSSFFSFSNWWKTAMLAQLDMPVERRVRALGDAMRGWGTDEYTLTGVICTLPENQHEDIASEYQKQQGQVLHEHVESETSFNYKKVLVAQTLPKIQSKCKALYDAMAGWVPGTNEGQLIRVLVCSSMKERSLIKQTYQTIYGRPLVDHIGGETSGHFKDACTAILETCDNPDWPKNTNDMDFNKDCEDLKTAMDGIGTDEDALIRVIAGKTPAQVQQLKDIWAEQYPEDGSLFDRVNGETNGIFESSDFRDTMLGLLRDPSRQLAYAVRYCIEGWGTCDIGLITLLVHLSEQKREVLRNTYNEIFSRDLIEDICSDTSGDYKRALCALVRPCPDVWADALKSSMAGIGTADNLLVNWMCISKDRMDEVRESFANQNGKSLVQWLEGDCSADYQKTLVAIANRQCFKFKGCEAQLTIPAPPTPELAIEHFRQIFVKLCRERAQMNPDRTLVPSEEDQQEMGMVFAYFGALCSCAPDLDKQGVWDLTNAIGFPPGDDGEDLDATFREWDLGGDQQVSWNDFVAEMTTRINDKTHYEDANAGLNI